jgi:hypothetical protein
MAEQQDWIDRAIAPDAWEPPAGFTDRLVVQALAALPRRVGLTDRFVATFTGLRESLWAKLELSAWVLTQYRELIFGAR